MRAPLRPLPVTFAGHGTVIKGTYTLFPRSPLG